MCVYMCMCFRCYFHGNVTENLTLVSMTGPPWKLYRNSSSLMFPVGFKKTSPTQTLPKSSLSYILKTTPRSLVRHQSSQPLKLSVLIFNRMMSDGKGAWNVLPETPKCGPWFVTHPWRLALCPSTKVTTPARPLGRREKSGDPPSSHIACALVKFRSAIPFSSESFQRFVGSVAWCLVFMHC